MNEIKTWVAVSPDAPEWMRQVARSLAEAGEDAHGAILSIQYGDRMSTMYERVSLKDVLCLISALANEVREQASEALGTALLEGALKGFTVEEEDEA